MALVLFIGTFSPAALAAENSLPWCIVNNSGKVLQCFTKEELCKKSAEKQNKSCVLIPPQKK
jgi:hypothetical protein